MKVEVEGELWRPLVRTTSLDDFRRLRKLSVDSTTNMCSSQHTLKGSVNFPNALVQTQFFGEESLEEEHFSDGSPMGNPNRKKLIYHEDYSKKLAFQAYLQRFRHHFLDSRIQTASLNNDFENSGSWSHDCMEASHHLVPLAEGDLSDYLMVKEEPGYQDVLFVDSVLPMMVDDISSPESTVKSVLDSKDSSTSLLSFHPIAEKAQFVSAEPILPTTLSTSSEIPMSWNRTADQAQAHASTMTDVPRNGTTGTSYCDDEAVGNVLNQHPPRLQSHLSSEDTFPLPRRHDSFESTATVTNLLFGQQGSLGENEESRNTKWCLPEFLPNREEVKILPNQDFKEMFRMSSSLFVDGSMKTPFWGSNEQQPKTQVNGSPSSNITTTTTTTSRNHNATLNSKRNGSINVPSKGYVAVGKNSIGQNHSIEVSPRHSIEQAEIVREHRHAKAMAHGGAGKSERTRFGENSKKHLTSSKRRALNYTSSQESEMTIGHQMRSNSTASTRSSRSETRGRTTFADMVRARFIKTGPQTWTVGHDANISVIVNSDGCILYKNSEYYSLSSFALAVIRERNPTRLACDGWKDVKYEGKRLDTLREMYLYYTPAT